MEYRESNRRNNSGREDSICSRLSSPIVDRIQLVLETLSNSSSAALLLFAPSSLEALLLVSCSSARDSRRSTRVQSRSNEPKMGEGGEKMKSYAVLSTLIGGQRARFERDLLIEEGGKKEKKNDRSSGSRYKCTKNRLCSRLEHSRSKNARTFERRRPSLLPL